MKKKAFLNMMKADRADIYEYIDGTHFAVPRHNVVRVGVVRQYHKLMEDKN